MKNQLRVMWIILLTSFCTHLVSAQWLQTNGPLGGQLNCLTVSGTNLYAGTDDGVYLSTNNGTSWTEMNTGLPHTWVHELVISGTNLFAGTTAGIFLSTNNGTSWTAVNTGLLSTSVYCLAVSGTNLFAGTYGGGVFLSTNSGTSWTEMNTGLTNKYVNALAISGTNLFAGTYSGSVFLSTNNGASWTAVNTGLPGTSIYCLAVSGTNLFAGTYGGGVFLSTNNGTSWTAVNTGLTSKGLYALAVSGTNLFAGTYGGGVFLSTNNGTSWTAVNNGLTYKDVFALAVSGTNLFAGTYGGGVFLSTNNGTNWTAANTGLTATTVNALAISGTNLFAGTSSSGAFLSTNNGTSWTAVNTGLTSTIVGSFAVSGTNLFAGTSNTGVFLSTNNGTSWTAVNTGLLSTSVYCLAASGTNLFAGTYDGGVFLSTNNGTSWTAMNTGLTTAYIPALAVSGGNLFAGTYNGGVFLSTNNGANWNPVNTGLTTTYVPSLAISGTNVFAGTDVGVFLSTNNGTSWTAVNTGLTATNVFALAISGMNLLAGTTAGVFLSTNNGASWTAVNSGLTNTSVRALAVSGTYLFAGTHGRSVWARPLSEIITGSASMSALASAQVPIGVSFWIDVKLGDPTAVADLYGISFKLKSNNPSCTYVDGSGQAGSFLGTSPLTIFQTLDAQTVDVAVTKTSGLGVNGSGVAARVQFKTSSTLSANTSVQFSMYDIVANNSSGGTIPISAGTLSVTFITGAQVWPGDCDNNGTVNAADLLPIGLYYNQQYGSANNPGNQWQAFTRLYWTNEPPGKKVYADADGNGTINAADLLPIGLNYGSTHQVTTNSAGSSVVAQTMAKATAQGSLAITSVTANSLGGARVSIPIQLKTTVPVYGIAFTLKSSTGIKFIGADTAGHVLTDAIMLTKAFDEQGSFDVGMTKVRGDGFTGIGQLITVEAELSGAATSPLSFDILNVVANDAKGNSVNITGSSYWGGVTSDQGSIIPTIYNLSQNYPNPFNPSTNFEFRIANFGFVSLKVFDVLGREVATLVHEERAAGVYVARWDATMMPSGVYYYRLTATEKSGSVFAQTRRLALVK